MVVMTTTATATPAPAQRRPLTEGETVSHPVGPDGHIVVTLQCVRLNAAYAVTVYSGSWRIEDNCSAFDNETDARTTARLYAQLYRAEQAA